MGSEYAQFEAAVNAMQTANAASAQIELNRLISSEAGWRFGVEAVASQNDNVRFFGALSLHLSLAREPGPPSANLSDILYALLQALSIEKIPFVATKMGVALSALMFRTCPQHPLQTIANAIPPQSLASTATLLSLFSVFAQELASRTFATQSQRISVFENVRNDVPAVLNLIASVLESVDYSNPDIFKVKVEALKCVLAWGVVEKAIPVESMPKLLTLVIQHLQHEATFIPSCQVLAELLTFKDLLVHERTICDALIPVLTDGIVAGEFRRCIEEEDVETGHAICSLLSQVGESFPKYIVKNLGTSVHVLRLIEMVLRFTAFPGYYGIDEDISHLPDEFWYEIEESLTDDTVVPALPPQANSQRLELSTDPVTHEPVLHGDGVRIDGTRLATRFLNRGSGGNSWDMSGFPEGAVERVWGAAREIFAALVGVVRSKIERPKELDFAGWNQDMREKFRLYRMDKGETLLACNRILGKSIYDILIPLAIQQIEEISQGRGEDGQALESTLFCLKSIAEEVFINDTPHLHILFGDAIMGRISAFPPTFWRVRLTFCLLIGEQRHPSWLNKNPVYLLPVITFLMNSLNVNAPLTGAAVSSLEQVCSVCRKQLGGIAQNMLDAWERMKPGLSSNDRVRLIRSVSAILEPLSPQEQLPHLMTLTGSMIGEMRTTLAVLAASPTLLSQPPEVEVAERLLVRDLLRLLKGVCQGIQKSEGDDVDDEDVAENGAIVVENDEAVDSFALLDSEMKGRMGQLSGVVWETLGAVFQVFSTDEETIDIACSLIIMTLQTKIPIMFTPNPSTLANLLLQSFSSNHFAIQIRVFTILFQSVKQGSNASGEDMLVVGDSSNMVLEWVCARLCDLNSAIIPLLLGNGNPGAAMAEHSDIVEAYFKLLTRVLAKHPWAIIRLPESHQQALFGDLILTGLGLQERSSCSAVVDFVRDLVSFNTGRSHSSKRTMGSKSMNAESQESQEAQKCRDLLHGGVAVIGARLVRVLIMDIGGGLPTSMWPLIADLLHRIITHFPDDARGWVVECLREEGFPTVHCTNADKEDFVKGIMVAQMKAFKDLVKTFGLKCRNLHDTSYGSSIRV
ncbi:hypothetical protein HDU77_004230 [Chytriomyces hyalinus]|nr:hypothetical protein HDU77_004230 [Chytriomyces hyalinus]